MADTNNDMYIDKNHNTYADTQLFQLFRQACLKICFPFKQKTVNFTLLRIQQLY